MCECGRLDFVTAEFVFEIRIKKMHPSDIAILIGGPILVSVLLFEANRERNIQLHTRGFFRFPLALLLSTVACLGTAVLYANVNPYVSSWILGLWP
jgi:hypothetical protein